MDESWEERKVRMLEFASKVKGKFREEIYPDGNREMRIVVREINQGGSNGK